MGLRGLLFKLLSDIERGQARARARAEGESSGGKDKGQQQTLTDHLRSPANK